MLAYRPLPKPDLIIHKYKRRPAGRDMTVCAGFLCTDGLIIGADTEFSGGVKFHAQKLRRESFVAGEYVITGTGNASFIGMAADIIAAALRSKREKFEKAANVKEKTDVFHASIRGLIRQIHKDYIDFPVYEGQLPHLELIIGAHFVGEGEEMKLMHCAADGSVNWIDRHIAIGMGGDIAMRFLTILAPGPRPMDLMTAVAFLCLAEAKLSAEGVGGNTELMKLPHPSPPIVQTWYSESPLLELAEEALQLAICIPREKLAREDFNEKLGGFIAKIHKVKTEVDRQPESQKIMLELIRKSRES